MRVVDEPGGCLRAVLLGLLLGLLLLPGPTAPASAEQVGSVSGTVTAAGEPVAVAWVTLMPVTPSGDWAGRPVQTTTDQRGRYVFGDLSVHHVKIQVRAPSFSDRASTYWPQAYAFSTAGILRVAASGSTADVDLPVGASVSGRVVDAVTGDPVLGARVTAHVDATPGWEPVGSAGPAGPGQFVITGVPPVPVALQVRPPTGSNHLGQWYDGAGFHGQADRVQPGTSDIVIRLREGGQVSGVVRDDLGREVPGAAVTIMRCPVRCPMTVVTDDEGAYRFTGVPAAPGLRAFVDATDVGLLSQWYAAPGPQFDLAAGEILDAIDFTVTRGALLTGRVIDGQTGVPIPGASAVLVDVDNPRRSFLPRVVEDPGAPAPAPPAFTIGPVPPGQYSLIVYPGARNGDYLPVQWVGSVGLDDAGLVDLHRGERAEVSVLLARQQVPEQGAGGLRSSGAGGDPGHPGPSGGWPGLFGGFLVADGASFLRLES